MEALPHTASHLHSPAAAFVAGTIARQDPQESTNSVDAWGISHLNPVNRIDSLTALYNPQWRIDGCARLGSQFYAIPLFFRTLPRSVIHLFIPEHSVIAPSLREDLDLSSAFSSTSSSQVEALGITRHILRALEYWTTNYPPPRLEDVFKTLPFGSCLVFENIIADIKQIRIRFVANHDLERQLLSEKDLQRIWGIEVSSPLPPRIDLTCLQLISQLHDTVSLVHRLDIPDTVPLIFKTQTIEPQFLYHELKVLLTLPPHPYIVPSPLNIVTKRCQFGKSVVIVGFTLQYFSRGSLASLVQKPGVEERPDLLRKSKWATQITHALIHLVENGAVHADLRLDNIVLSNTDDVVLIDHEQKGVWHALAAPEVNCLDYLHELAFSTSVATSVRNHYRSLINQFQSCIPPSGKRYRNPPHGYNFPFAVLDADERESVMVYLLGFTLWCLFEDIETAEPYYGKASPMDDVRDPLQFPDFDVTPMELRSMIEKCTNGRLRDEEKFPIVRRGKYLVTRRQAEDVGVGSRDSIEQELESMVRKWWLKQIEEMESYIAYRKPVGDESREPKSLFSRPRLKDVLGVIEDFREKLG